jgi:hypothetical protein
VAAVVDTFDRADSGTLGTADSGQAWTPNGFGVASNAADYGGSADSAYHFALVDGGAADGEVRLLVDGFNRATPADVGVVYRAADQSNLMYLELTGSGGNIVVRLFKRVAGTFTALTVARTLATYSIPRIELRVRYAGTVHDIIAAGQLIDSVDVGTTGLESNTLIGLGGFADTAGLACSFPDFSGGDAVQDDSLFGGRFPIPPSGQVRDLSGSGDTTHYAMGTCIQPQVDGTVTAVKYYVAAQDGLQPSAADFGVGLFSIDPVLGIPGGVTSLAWQAESLPSGTDSGQWVTYPLDTPVDVAAGDLIYPVVRTNRYGFAAHVFDSAVTNGESQLVGRADLGAAPNGAFVQGSDSTATPPVWAFASAFNSTFYGVDLVFTPAGAGGTTVITGLPAETDAPLAAGRRKTRTSTEPAETDAVLTGRRVKVRTTGLPAELDVALPAIDTTPVLTGLPGELDAVLPGRRVKVRTTGLPAELDGALATAGRRKTRTTGLPAELDVALPAFLLVIPGRPVAGSRLARTATASIRPSTVEASDR